MNKDQMFFGGVGVGMVIAGSAQSGWGALIGACLAVGIIVAHEISKFLTRSEPEVSDNTGSRRLMARKACEGKHGTSADDPMNVMGTRGESPRI